MVLIIFFFACVHTFVYLGIGWSVLVPHSVFVWTRSHLEMRRTKKTQKEESKWCEWRLYCIVHEFMIPIVLLVVCVCVED